MQRGNIGETRTVGCLQTQRSVSANCVKGDNISVSFTRFETDLQLLVGLNHIKNNKVLSYRR